MSAMKEISDQLMIVTSDTEKLKSEVCQVNEAVVETKKAVRSLKIHVDELDQEKRSSSVFFLNEWPESKTESTLSLVQNYIQEALHIDVHDNDISRCFRMGEESQTFFKAASNLGALRLHKHQDSCPSGSSTPSKFRVGQLSSSGLYQRGSDCLPTDLIC